MKELSNDFKHLLNFLITLRDAHGIYDLVLTEARTQGNEDLIWLLRHLGRVAEPEIVKKDDKRVNSAAIFRTGSRFYLRFNEEFLQKYIETPSCLLHLVLHELGHKVRGDLHRPIDKDSWKYSDLRDYIRNVVADLLLDAFLRRLTFFEPPPYLKALYTKGSLFMRLLCPPEALMGITHSQFSQMSERERRKRIIPVLKEGIDILRGYLRRWKNSSYRAITRWRELPRRLLEKAYRVYQAGWLETPSFDSIYIALMHFIFEIMAFEGLDAGIIRHVDLPGIFIGNHKDDDGSGADPWNHWFKNNVWLKGLRSNIPGFSNIVYNEQIDTKNKEEKIRQLYEAIRRAMVPDPRHSVAREQLLPISGVVPFPGRREVFFIAGGYQPAFYPNPIPQQDWDEYKVHLYLDVSGSMDKYLPFLFGLMIHLKDLIGEPIYGFSNAVAPISIENLREGFYQTTGGTDFDCVARHTLENRFHRILIITDGYGGFTGPLKEEIKKKVDLFAIIIKETYEPDGDLIEVIGKDKKGQKWWQIEEDVIRT